MGRIRRVRRGEERKAEKQACGGRETGRFSAHTL